MGSKYTTLKTDSIGAKWKGVVPIDNIRTYPKKTKKKWGVNPRLGRSGQ